MYTLFQKEELRGVFERTKREIIREIGNYDRDTETS